jgi:hypothetical protein
MKECPEINQQFNGKKGSIEPFSDKQAFLQ